MENLNNNFEILYKSKDVCLLNNNKNLIFVANSIQYNLSSNPYEPCLYMNLNNEPIIVIHNSFTIDEIIYVAKKDNKLKIISGNEYDISGVCELLLCAVNQNVFEADISYLEGLLVIDQLKNCGAFSQETAIDISTFGIKNINIMYNFLHTKKIKKTDDNRFFIYSKESNKITNGTITELIDDLFYKEYKKYTGCVLDYCILKNSSPYNSIKSHKESVIFAMKKWQKFLKKEYDLDIYYYEEKMKATKLESNTFFKPLSESKNDKSYYYLFTHPPYGNIYTSSDFIKINNILFPNGFNNLEIYEWSTDWSNYFDDGLEWWGAKCISIYDKSLDRFIIIGASATD